MDVSDLRSEIKSWEREFRDEHGRGPLVQDIKDRPDVAEKYRLYKKLSKAKSSTHTVHPSTPPKPQQNSLIPKSQAIKTQAPTVSNNPFSPVKNGEKHRHAKHTQSTRAAPNPFVTPSKNDKPPREPSPNPFLPSQPAQVASSSKLIIQPPPNSAISRARKRLRGEPVSPSPVKVKRQRVTSQISLQLTHDDGTSDSDDDSKDGDAAEVSLTYVVDSPVKAPVGSKSFLSLFNENTSTRSDKPDGSKRTTSRSNTRAGPFDRDASVFSDDDMDKSAVLSTQVTQKARLKKQIENVQNQRGVVSNGVDTRKRPLYVSEMEGVFATQPKVPLLIPPSPPPVSSIRNSNRYDVKAKAKATGTSSRKKHKLAVNSDEGEDEDSEDEKIKVIEWRPSQRKEDEEQELWKDDEPIFRNRISHSEQTSLEGPSKIEDTFTVDIPQELLQVLAISPSKSGLAQDDHLVRALLRGTRPGHYDGNRGGYIWDVGETERDETDSAERWRGEGEEVVHGGNVAGEDDEWEGEAIPWQVAEL